MSEDVEADSYFTIAGMPQGCGGTYAVLTSEPVVGEMTLAARKNAAIASWKAYLVEHKRLGNSCRSRKVRLLVFASLAFAETATSVIEPMLGPRIKLDDGTEGNGAARGMIRKYPPLTIVKVESENEEVVNGETGEVIGGVSEPEPCVTDDGAWVYSIDHDNAHPAIPWAIARKVVERWKIGAKVAWPKRETLATFGGYESIVETHKGPTIGHVVTCEGFARLLYHVGIALHSSHTGALILPQTAEQCIDWACSIHGSKDPAVMDEADYEQAKVLVMVGERTLDIDTMTRANKRACIRLNAGAGCGDHVVYRDATLKVPAAVAVADGEGSKDQQDTPLDPYETEPAEPTEETEPAE